MKTVSIPVKYLWLGACVCSFLLGRCTSALDKIIYIGQDPDEMHKALIGVLLKPRA